MRAHGIVNGAPVWTKADARYLKSLRVEVDDPPPALPRFQVEPIADGEYQVIDALLKHRATHTISAQFENPRAVAEAIADELNQKYERQE